MADGSVAADYYRLGVSEDADARGAWRLDGTANEHFALCSTYPRELAIPSAATPAMLEAVATYRSRGRIPVLCWRDPAGASGHLTRSAQPSKGLLGKHSKADEQWVSLLRSAAGETRRFVLLDCRSYAAAHANRFRGGGVERPARYGLQTIEYCSLRACKTLSTGHCHSPSRRRAHRTCPVVFRNLTGNVHHVRRVVLAMRATPRSVPLSRSEQARWLQLQSSLLQAATRAARLLQSGATVLLHCSDGWDRTPQVSSLAQLMLDPHYRTVQGLLLLVGKEWLGFGHRFQLRHELGQPIFLQFLDALYQMVEQQPHAFGFTALLLADVLAVHDGAPPSGCATPHQRFPFDRDSEAQREAQRSHDVTGGGDEHEQEHWASFFLDESRIALYSNPGYVPPVDGLDLMHVDTRLHALRIWPLVRSPPSCAQQAKGARVAVSFALCCPGHTRDLQLIVEADDDAHADKADESGIELKEQA